MRRTKPLSPTPFKRKPPDPEKAKATKRRQQKRARQKHEDAFGPHAEWVRENGCEVRNCFAAASVHHEPPRKMGGSKEPTAHRATGLCAHHHTDGPQARHKIGLAKFNAAHGTDLLAAADRNWKASPFNPDNQ